MAPNRVAGSYDVIVVGAGVLGAATAYELSTHGAAVALVDAQHPGRATSAGAGIVSPWTSRTTDDEVYRLATAGASRYPSLIDELAELEAPDSGYRRVGALCPLEDADQDAFWRRLEPRIADAEAHGEVRAVTHEQARELFPPLRADLGGVYLGGAARVDGRKLGASLQSATRNRGARIVPGRARLDVEGGRARGVAVNGETLRADTVVLCAGAWTGSILAEVGLDFPEKQQRGQILHLRLADTNTARWPVLLPVDSHYMVCFDDSRVVVGATREPGHWLDLAPTAAGLHELLEFGLRLAPGLAGAAHIETRVGYRPMPPGTRPQLGAAQDVRGVVVASGLGASGLTIGPYLARLTAQFALGYEPEIGINGLDPWQEIVAQHDDDSRTPRS